MLNRFIDWLSGGELSDLSYQISIYAKKTEELHKERHGFIKQFEEKERLIARLEIENKMLRTSMDTMSEELRDFRLKEAKLKEYKRQWAINKKSK